MKKYKQIIYPVLAIFIMASMVLFIVSCGGGGGVTPSVNTNSSQGETGSLKLDVLWPDSKGLSASYIHPDVVKIEISITSATLTTPRVEYINKPETSKTIDGLHAEEIIAELKGLNAGGTVLSHRITEVLIKKGETVTTDLNLGVSILGTGFYPPSIPIKVNETIYWNNNDITAHTVTADDGSFNSDTYFPAGIPAGGEYWHTFNSDGTFGYKCTIGNLTGNVVVGMDDPNGDSSMVSIPGGTFDMGSNIYEDEQPVHSVQLSSFSMGKYEVTNTEYCAFLNSQGNQTEGGVLWIKLVLNEYQGITGGSNPGTFAVVSGYESRPVVRVSWYGAVAYCNWLSTQQGLTPCYGPINNRGNDPSVWRTLNGYRLPTEAEWEFACRGGNAAEYYWGEPYPPDPPGIGNYAWYLNNAGDGYGGSGNRNHHIVGQKLPNSYGLYDMSGNVWEWCSDGYDSGYYWVLYHSISPSTNPAGPVAGLRVFRGGSWYDFPDDCRSANRDFNTPEVRYDVLGFRLVRN